MASPRKFATDEAMMTQGDFGHCLFLVKTSTTDVSVERRLVRSVGPGALSTRSLSCPRVVGQVESSHLAALRHQALQVVMRGRLATKRPSGHPTSRRTGRAAERGDSAQRRTLDRNPYLASRNREHRVKRRAELSSSRLR